MMRRVDAIVRDGMLCPLEPIRLPTGARVRVQFADDGERSREPSAQSERLRLLDQLAALGGWDPLGEERRPPTLDW